MNANLHRQQVAEEAQRTLNRAQREAEQIVSAAQTQANTFIDAGHEEARQQLSALTHEVDQLTRRRDAIAAQLGALRDVVGGFATTPAEQD
jgi:F0F1-type ATP synthase membrane subunit b/b'